MSECTEECERVKEVIMTAWGKNDLISLMCTGIKNLANMIRGNGGAPISFQMFLEPV